MSGSAQIIVNRRSGAGDKSELNERIEAAFRRHGWPVDFVTCQRRDMERRIEDAARRPGGTIVAAGGDGTINAVACACLRAQRPFGIVPAGTFNYVARNLGIPPAIDDAVATIVAGATRALDVGEVNGRLFLNNAGVGLYSHLIERREEDKCRFGRKRIVGLFSGLRCLLDRHPLHRFELRADGQPQRLRTTTLFFGCNALQLENYNVAARNCLHAGRLAVLSLAVHSRADIARAVWAALMTGALESADAIESFCAREVRLSTPRKALKVAIDGEIVVMRPPLELRLRRGALQVYAPEAVS